MNKPNVILLSPGFHAEDVGESYVSFKWAQALSQRVNLTTISFQRSNRPLTADQLPDAEVITFPEPDWLMKFERFNAMFKPAWPLYMHRVRGWIRAEQVKGRHFDIAHQIAPIAARYPSPLQGTGIPYLVGPVGGGLPTPEGFRNEVTSASWFTRLRGLDQFRFARDPWLRRSYGQAEAVLGVAPYVKDVLHLVPMKRFETMLELGVDNVPPFPARPPRGGLRLLHVGRAVRTKGLRDVVRAMAHLKDVEGVTLISAGGGEEVAPCQAEAEALGVADRITFLGKVPREKVDQLYEDADIFIFPSFREPTGGVLYEAMRAGLPTITVAYGGPEAIIAEDCGVRLPLSSPDALARDIARAVRPLHADPARRQSMGQAAHAKISAEGLWPAKAAYLTGLYSEILAPMQKGAPQ